MTSDRSDRMTQTAEYIAELYGAAAYVHHANDYDPTTEAADDRRRLRRAYENITGNVDRLVVIDRILKEML